MEPSGTTLGTTVWELPPLILHPFNERVPPSELLENSRASLMLNGLLPRDGDDDEELSRRVLAGRYAEIRMLFFLGRDLLRWVGQCMESIARVPELAQSGIREQSFAALVASNPPDAVRSKLASWGVSDYSSLFSRAVGLNGVFAEPPPPELLAPGFLQSYHRFADHLWACYLRLQSYQPVGPENFQFELYASGEYSRLLEARWGAE